MVFGITMLFIFMVSGRKSIRSSHTYSIPICSNRCNSKWERIICTSGIQKCVWINTTEENVYGPKLCWMRHLMMHSSLGNWSHGDLEIVYYCIFHLRSFLSQSVLLRVSHQQFCRI